MAQPQLLQAQFSRMVRDRSRDALPPDAVWNLSDYIPNLGAPLRKRGGWPYHGSPLTSLDASAGLPSVVAVASFLAGTQVLVLDDRANPELFDLTNSADRGSLYGASAGRPLGPPVFYREQLLFPSHDIDASPVNPRKYVAAGTISDLSGAPGSRYFAVYKDRVAAAAADTDTPNRIYFSAAGNAESWDTAARYIDTSAPPIALAPLRNALIVFHSGSVERIRGDIPPGSAAANMTLEPLFDDVGAVKSDAIAVAGDFVYFADESGVYRTDGASLTNLTRQGEIETFWRTQFAASASDGVTMGAVALVVWRGYLFCSLQTPAGSFIDFLVCDLDRRHWFRFTNILAYNFAIQYGATDELYFSNRDTSSKRVGKLSSLFDPTASVKNDANTTAVTPVLETGLYDANSPVLKRWKHGYLSYLLEDAATDNPALTMSYLRSPEETSYTAISPTLPENTRRERKRVPLAFQDYGVALKIAQTNASADTRLFAIEAEVEAKEGSRLRAA